MLLKAAGSVLLAWKLENMMGWGSRGVLECPELLSHFLHNNCTLRRCLPAGVRLVCAQASG